MGKILAVCISEKKGTTKENVKKAYLKEQFGLENDAHGGKWHRQVSLLGAEENRGISEKNLGASYGAFRENLVVESFDFRQLRVGSRFAVGRSIVGNDADREKNVTMIV